MAAKRLPSSIHPTEPNLIISDSSFFSRHASLPSFEQVREQARGQYRLNITTREWIAIFEDLGLVVKFGAHISIAEGQCLLAIRQLFGSAVPVPELYAWLTDGKEVFIFMELVQGVTLEKRWDSLGHEGRQNVVWELRKIMNTLREAKQGPTERFIGHVACTPLQDVAFPSEVFPTAGPFLTVKDFHDWFSNLYRRHLVNPDLYQRDPYRPDLPDDAPIKLTHGDLHRSNIIVTDSDPPSIAALIDWHQAGWLPGYWEAIKAQYTVFPESEWAKIYIPQFLEKWDDNTLQAWDFYVMATGN